MPTLSTLYPDHGPWNCFDFTKQNTDQNYIDSCIICVMSDDETLWVHSEYERFDQSNIEYDTNNQLEYVGNYIVHGGALFRMHARCHVRRHVTVRTNMLKRVRLIYRRTSNYWIVSGKKTSVYRGTWGSRRSACGPNENLLERLSFCRYYPACPVIFILMLSVNCEIKIQMLVIQY